MSAPATLVVAGAVAAGSSPAAGVGAPGGWRRRARSGAGAGGEWRPRGLRDAHEARGARLEGRGEGPPEEQQPDAWEHAAGGYRGGPPRLQVAEGVEWRNGVVVEGRGGAFESFIFGHYLAREPGSTTTVVPFVAARQIGLPGLSATPWATIPGRRMG